MQSKLFFLLIFSLTFSSNEKYNKKRKRELEKNILDCKNSLDTFQNTFNFIQSANVDIFQNSNPQNIETHSNSPELATKEQENCKVPSEKLKTQKITENPIPVDSLKTHENAKSSYNLLDIKPNIFRSIFAYLSLFELELSFKCASIQVYNLYNKFLKEEKNMLIEAKKNKLNFFKNRLNYTRIYFNFFEKRLWSNPDRIEYVNVDSFSTNLVLFPKSIRQIVRFKYQQNEYQYILFKDGQLSILKKIDAEEGKFFFTSLKNDYTRLPALNSVYNLPLTTGHAITESVRWMNFYTEDKIPCTDSTVLNQVCVDLYKTNNFEQTICHNQVHQKIMISGTSQILCPMLILKNYTGYLKLVFDGVKLWRFEKQRNGKYTQCYDFWFKPGVKEIQSKDYEHYAHEVKFLFAHEVKFLSNS